MRPTIFGKVFADGTIHDNTARLTSGFESFSIKVAYAKSRTIHFSALKKYFFHHSHKTAHISIFSSIFKIIKISFLAEDFCLPTSLNKDRMGNYSMDWA